MEKAGVEGWPATGDTWRIRSWAKDHGCYFDTPAPGDVFLQLGADGMPTHTGFVDTVNANTHTFRSVEGNYQDGVRSITRSWTGHAFVHWQPVLGGGGSPAPEPDGQAIKIYWHDGKGTIMINGRISPVKGVKIGDTEATAQPWAGGFIKVGY